jgi:hypothetical protein
MQDSTTYLAQMAGTNEKKCWWVNLMKEILEKRIA